MTADDLAARELLSNEETPDAIKDAIIAKGVEEVRAARTAENPHWMDREDSWQAQTIASQVFKRWR